MKCEARLEPRLEVWSVGISGLNGGCVKIKSEEVTLIFSGLSKVRTHTHTHTITYRTHLHHCWWCEGLLTSLEGGFLTPLSTPGCGSMMRNFSRCVMKTLNPHLLFQGDHFFDERWCYDSKGLQSKTLCAPPSGALNRRRQRTRRSVQHHLSKCVNLRVTLHPTYPLAAAPALKINAASLQQSAVGSLDGDTKPRFTASQERLRSSERCEQSRL